MLLTMLYIESYLTESVTRLKVHKLPLTIRGSLFVPEHLSEGRGSFGGKTLHDISNTKNTDAMTPTFRYVAQYVLC